MVRIGRYAFDIRLHVRGFKPVCRSSAANVADTLRGDTLCDGDRVDANAEIALDRTLEIKFGQAAADDFRPRRHAVARGMDVRGRPADVDKHHVAKAAAAGRTLGDQLAGPQHRRRRRYDRRDEIEYLCDALDALGLGDVLDEQIADDLVNFLDLDAIDIGEDI